jgi:hypothetical protein
MLYEPSRVSQKLGYRGFENLQLVFAGEKKLHGEQDDRDSGFPDRKKREGKGERWQSNYENGSEIRCSAPQEAKHVPAA